MLSACRDLSILPLSYYYHLLLLLFIILTIIILLSSLLTVRYSPGDSEQPYQHPLTSWWVPMVKVLTEGAWMLRPLTEGFDGTDPLAGRNEPLTIGCAETHYLVFLQLARMPPLVSINTWSTGVSSIEKKIRCTIDFYNLLVLTYLAIPKVVSLGHLADSSLPLNDHVVYGRTLSKMLFLYCFVL